MRAKVNHVRANWEHIEPPPPALMAIPLLAVVMNLQFDTL
jgi:hypothetical protein